MRTIRYAFPLAVLVTACSGGSSSTTPGSQPGADGGESTAADFYVAPNGNDGWSGKLAAPSSDGTDGPFATIGAAQSAVRGIVAGRSTPIVVDVRAGTYAIAAALNFGMQDSGTTSAPITYQAYPGETPVVSGGVAISGFAQSSPGLFVANAPGLANVTQVFVNGDRRYRVRTTESSYLVNAQQFTFQSPTKPTNPPCTPYALLPNSTDTYACYDRFYFKSGDIDPSWSGLSDPSSPIEILGFENWTMSRMRLKSIDATSSVPGAGIAYLTGSTAAAEFFGFKTGHRYLIENVAEALKNPADHAGRFFYDAGKGKLALVPKDASEDLTTETAIVGQASQLLVANGTSHVTFHGITFSHTAWDAGAAGFEYPDAGQYGPPAAIELDGVSDVTFDGCTIAHTSGYGIDVIGAPDGGFTPTSDVPWAVQIAHSTFTDTGAGALRIGRDPQKSDTDANVAHHVYVYDDLMQSGDRMMPAAGIWIGDAHDVTIDHIEMSDFYNMGVDIGHSLNWVQTAVHDVVVTNSKIFNLGQGVTSDMGAVHTATSLSHGNKITGNVFHDIVQDPDPSIGYGGDGIYLDQGSENFVIQNNVVWNVTDGAFHYNASAPGLPYFDASSGPSLVTNNVFAYSGSSIHFGLGNDGAHDVDFAKNIFYWDHIANRGSTVHSPQSGDFQCNDPAEPKACPSYFSFENNLWFDASDPGAKNWHFFTGVGQGNSSNYTLVDAAGWQALGEDVGTSTIVADPLFANASSGDFGVAPSSPAASMGFATIDVSQAGLVQGKSAPALLSAFPTTLPTSF